MPFKVHVTFSFLYLYFVDLILYFYILFIIYRNKGFLDFTCYNDNPRILLYSDIDLFIGGYKSGNDIDARVTFERASDTGTGSGLPSVMNTTNIMP